MKAFLLAAGHGTRLRPITDTIPKCLLPIQGVPLLALWLQCCERLRIDEVMINLHAHAAPVREFLRRNAPATPVRVVEEPELLGSAGDLARANRDWIGSDDLFWIFYADVLNCADLEGTTGGYTMTANRRRPSVPTKSRIPAAAASLPPMSTASLSSSWKNLRIRRGIGRSQA